MAENKHYGSFFLELRSDGGGLPVTGALVQISHGGVTVSSLYTDSGGSAFVSLPCPDRVTSQTPGCATSAYYTYDVRVSENGYVPVIFRGIQVFPGVTTRQKYDMTRSDDGRRRKIEVVETPPHCLTEKNAPVFKSADVPVQAAYAVPRKVLIPETITVHLGAPNENARNVTVPYVDYLKSVASSEIYPTWPIASLRANVYAQSSLALNRIYTEWYRSQGYDFDITSSPAYDQYYVHQRSTFDSVSAVVDEQFTNYVARANNIEPVFTRYCDGYASQCLGMSQWGTVELANKYYTPLDILRHYYGENVYIGSADVVELIPDSYHGELSSGSSGNDVALVQDRLNRIAINYPSLPFVEFADGTYTPSTKRSVSEFQRIFGLPVTGTVDKKTWYRILYIYTAVKKLAELDSEGERIFNEGFPGIDLTIGTRDLGVIRMEFYLQRISEALGNDVIPRPRINGVYDVDTRDAVSAFQRYYGLSPTGVVNEATWNAIVRVYYDLPGQTLQYIRPYPGTPVKYGDRGNNVSYVQTALNFVSREAAEIPPVEADGIFGNMTRNAVKTFQKFYGLAEDGIVGPLTWNKLNEIYSKIKASSDGDVG